MAIGIVFEIPGGTQKQYDKVMELLKLGGKLDPGCLYHVAGPMDGGWRVVDVWESNEHFEKFFKAKLQSALKAAAVPPMQPKFFPVHNVLKAA
jgi:hypothetical protein